jgi:hypothetical protein
MKTSSFVATALLLLSQTMIVGLLAFGAASLRNAVFRIIGGFIGAAFLANAAISLVNLALIGDALPGGEPTPAGTDHTRIQAVTDYAGSIMALLFGWAAGRRHRLGSHDRSSLHPFLRKYGDEQMKRWLFLRAVEWIAWPIFITQPMVPLLLIWFPLWRVLLSIAAASLAWRVVCVFLVSPALSWMGAWFVTVAKWPSALIAAAVLGSRGRYLAAAIALAWPFLTGLITAPVAFLAALFRLRAQVGHIELTLAHRTGYMRSVAETSAPSTA